MGYDANLVGASNYRSILRDFGPGGDYGTVGLVEEHYDRMTYDLRLVARIPAGFSGHLAYLVDEILVSLCNDYPVYDECDYSELEGERTIEAIEEARAEGDPDAHDIQWAFWELSIQPINESDGSVYISEADFAEAVKFARTNPGCAYATVTTTA
jgi:hypothetical protein